MTVTGAGHKIVALPALLSDSVRRDRMQTVIREAGMTAMASAGRLTPPTWALKPFVFADARA